LILAAAPGAGFPSLHVAGISDYLGIDGDYLPRKFLKIPESCFRAGDLTTMADVGRRFDMALSLEVAEHLPISSAENFVKLLVGAAPVVVFSGAVPYQVGTDHINAQWQSYWATIFCEISICCNRLAYALTSLTGMMWNIGIDKT
jgi:hypothetical protein